MVVIGGDGQDFFCTTAKIVSIQYGIVRVAQGCAYLVFAQFFLHFFPLFALFFGISLFFGLALLSLLRSGLTRVGKADQKLLV